MNTGLEYGYQSGKEQKRANKEFEHGIKVAKFKWNHYFGYGYQSSEPVF